MSNYRFDTLKVREGYNPKDHINHTSTIWWYR